jgi:hypothetical protein
MFDTSGRRAVPSPSAYQWRHGTENVGTNQPFRERLGGTASAVFTPACNLELEELRARTDSKAETVGEVALAIGKLRGHLRRKEDGLPGWETLWRGMQTLNLLVEDIHITRKLTNFG